MSYNEMGFILESLKGSAKTAAYKKIIEKSFAKKASFRIAIIDVNLSRLWGNSEKSRMAYFTFDAKILPGSITIEEDRKFYEVSVDYKKVSLTPTKVEGYQNNPYFSTNGSNYDYTVRSKSPKNIYPFFIIEIDYIVSLSQNFSFAFDSLDFFAKRLGESSTKKVIFRDFVDSLNLKAVLARKG